MSAQFCAEPSFRPSQPTKLRHNRNWRDCQRGTDKIRNINHFDWIDILLFLYRPRVSLNYLISWRVETQNWFSLPHKNVNHVFFCCKFPQNRKPVGKKVQLFNFLFFLSFSSLLFLFSLFSPQSHAFLLSFTSLVFLTSLYLIPLSFDLSNNDWCC